MYLIGLFSILIYVYNKGLLNSNLDKSLRLVMHSFDMPKRLLIFFYCCSPIPMKSSIYELSILWHVSIYLSGGRCNADVQTMTQRCCNPNSKSQMVGLVCLRGPWILRSSVGISHFSGIFLLAQGGLNPLQPGNWSSRLPGIREGGILRPVQS